MKTVIEISNQTGLPVGSHRQVDDDWSAPAHKYGADKPTQFVPVIQLPLPEHNPLTQSLATQAELIDGSWVQGYQVVNRPPPGVVPLWAFLDGLDQFNLRAQVDAFVAALPTAPVNKKRQALKHMEYGNFIHRDHELVIACAAHLGWTTEQVDELFAYCGSL